MYSQEIGDEWQTSWSYLFHIYNETMIVIRDHFMEGEIFVNGSVAQIELLPKQKGKVHCACMVARHFPGISDHNCKVLDDWETKNSTLLTCLYESTYKEVTDYPNFVSWMYKLSETTLVL